MIRHTTCFEPALRLVLNAGGILAEERAPRAQHGHFTAPIAFLVTDVRAALVIRVPQGCAKDDLAADPNGTCCTASVTSDLVEELVEVCVFLDSHEGGV
jgi:hypothetical protein